MQPKSQHRHRTTVAVVGWIVDELVVEGEPPRADGQRVVGLEDLLEAGVR
jgi:hypothetical protein